MGGYDCGKLNGGYAFLFYFINPSHHCQTRFPVHTMGCEDASDLCSNVGCPCRRCSGTALAIIGPPWILYFFDQQGCHASQAPNSPPVGHFVTAHRDTILLSILVTSACMCRRPAWSPAMMVKYHNKLTFQLVTHKSSHGALTFIAYNPKFSANYPKFRLLSGCVTCHWGFIRFHKADEPCHMSWGHPLWSKKYSIMCLDDMRSGGISLYVHISKQCIRLDGSEKAVSEALSGVRCSFRDSRVPEFREGREGYKSLSEESVRRLRANFDSALASGSVPRSQDSESSILILIVACIMITSHNKEISMKCR